MTLPDRKALEKARAYRITAALLEGKCVESGEPDYAAQLAEVGTGFAVSTTSGIVDDWDWQRVIALPNVDGKWLIETYQPTGAVLAAGYYGPPRYWGESLVSHHVQDNPPAWWRD